ncbi:MAG: NAD-dependent deacylase [Peptococcia bacterium]
MEQINENIIRVASMLSRANYVIALTGAGISTESGIPDFRGEKGVWKRDPEAERKAYQIYNKFRTNPKEYWKDRLSGRGILGDLSGYQPNKGHYALAELESMGVLKSIITQNVDNLHNKAGSQKVFEYHGNAFKLRCLSCYSRFDVQDFKLDSLYAKDLLPPLCKVCGSPLKSDIVDFNEPIPTDVVEHSQEETLKCDLMLICGTSAAVWPFAGLPLAAKRRGKVTIIEINLEESDLSRGGISDIFIKGRTGEILPKIVQQLKSLNV